MGRDQSADADLEQRSIRGLVAHERRQRFVRIGKQHRQTGAGPDQAVCFQSGANQGGMRGRSDNQTCVPGPQPLGEKRRHRLDQRRVVAIKHDAVISCVRRRLGFRGGGWLLDRVHGSRS
jgi:hypothetical protein